MTYELYIDVIFFTNWIADFILLALLRVVLKYQRKKFRTLAGSALGAAYASLVIAFPVLPLWVEAILTYLVVSCLMVFVAFGIRDWRELAKAVLYLYLGAALMAGIGFYFHNTRAGDYLAYLWNGRILEAMPISIWLLLMAGTYFGLKYLWTVLGGMRKREQNFYLVTLHYRGAKREIKALLDTGNHLFDPVSRRPVSVVSYGELTGFCESVSNLIMIPFQAVGTKQGMLPAVRMDGMEIVQGEWKRHVEAPLIAISREPLSPDGSYGMLLHEKMMEE